MIKVLNKKLKKLLAKEVGFYFVVLVDMRGCRLPSMCIEFDILFCLPYDIESMEKLNSNIQAFHNIIQRTKSCYVGPQICNT